MLAFLCYSCKANEFLLCKSRGLTMSLVSVIELQVTGQGCRVWLAFLVWLYLFSKVPREYYQRGQITGTLGKITYYIWGFFLSPSAVCECISCLHPCLYTWFLHYSSQDYDPLTFSAYEQLGFDRWREDSQCLSSKHALSSYKMHPSLTLSWFLKIHWFQIHLVPKLLKFWIHLGPWPIWFCICCESIFTKYSRPFLLTLSFLPCLKPKHV